MCAAKVSTVWDPLSYLGKRSRDSNSLGANNNCGPAARGVAAEDWPTRKALHSVLQVFEAAKSLVRRSDAH